MTEPKNSLGLGLPWWNGFLMTDLSSLWIIWKGGVGSAQQRLPNYLNTHLLNDNDSTSAPSQSNRGLISASWTCIRIAVGECAILLLNIVAAMLGDLMIMAPFVISEILLTKEETRVGLTVLLVFLIVTPVARPKSQL